MLAKKYIDQDPTGWLMSEKLDGVRAIWTGERLISRTGKQFAAPEWFISGLPTNLILDGELWEDRGLFQHTVGKVRTQINPDYSGVKYMLFDIVSSGPAEERQAILNALELPSHVEVLEQTVCEGLDHLEEYEARILAIGGEGVMLREPCSIYEHKRSGSLLKVKRFRQDEAEVIDYEAGRGRNTGRVGALLCRFRDKLISIGAGLSDADRRHPPEKGDVVTFSYFELTDSGMPRFPVFIAERDYE